MKITMFQSVAGNMVAFRVHAPCSGAFLLDIFANAVTPKEYLTGEPMKFKSVCKFKICCEDLQTVMVPLPDCASGEWGPTKATRLFGLVPITHQVKSYLATPILLIIISIMCYRDSDHKIYRIQKIGISFCLLQCVHNGRFNIRRQRADAL